MFTLMILAALVIAAGLGLWLERELDAEEQEGGAR